MSQVSHTAVFSKDEGLNNIQNKYSYAIIYFQVDKHNVHFRAAFRARLTARDRPGVSLGARLGWRWENRQGPGCLRDCPSGCTSGASSISSIDSSSLTDSCLDRGPRCLSFLTRKTELSGHRSDKVGAAEALARWPNHSQRNNLTGTTAISFFLLPFFPGEDSLPQTGPSPRHMDAFHNFSSRPYHAR